MGNQLSGEELQQQQGQGQQQGSPTTTNGDPQQQQQQQAAGSSASSIASSFLSRSSLVPPMHHHHHHLRNLLRPSTGALGLSKAELDALCQPSGIYPTCPWEDKAIRRLIADGKLAPRLVGAEGGLQQQQQRQNAEAEDGCTAGEDQGNTTSNIISTIECPICFLHYTAINVTKCCQAFVCTECYLQIRPQKQKAPTCPYCNSPKLSVRVLANMSETVAAVQQQEQMAIEAQIQKQQRQEQAEQEESHSISSSNGNVGTPSRFGASLERTLSDASSSNFAIPTDLLTAQTSQDSFGSARSVSERLQLEAEMRAQQYHPLAQRLQQEEEQRRLQNERDYYRNNNAAASNDINNNNRARLGELRAARRELLLVQQHHHHHAAAVAHGGAAGQHPQHQRSRSRDWNRIVDAFENNGGRAVQSLDDLVVLEAAIMLSMEEEARRRSSSRRGASEHSQSNQDHSTNHANDDDEDEEEDVVFDAAEHARAGFPLARNRVARSAGAATGTDNDSSHNTDNQNDIASSATAAAGMDLSSHMQSLMRNLQTRRSWRGGSRTNSGSHDNINSSSRGGSGGYHDARLDTVSLLMRGISEEEQLAIAIAASLEEQHRPQEQAEDVEGGRGESEQQQSTSTNSSSEATEGVSRGANISGADVDVDAVAREPLFPVKMDRGLEQAPPHSPAFPEEDEAVAKMEAAPEQASAKGHVTPQEAAGGGGPAQAPPKCPLQTSAADQNSTPQLKQPPPGAGDPSVLSAMAAVSKNDIGSLKVTATTSSTSEDEEVEDAVVSPSESLSSLTTHKQERDHQQTSTNDNGQPVIASGVGVGIVEK